MGAVQESQTTSHLADASPRVGQLRQLQALADGAAGLPSHKNDVEAVPPNPIGLPDRLKTGIEALSGLSMDHVRVHYNSPQPAQLNALAYAQGSDIHLAPGQERHLPHEAWHVVQQAQQRVRPTMQLNDGIPVNDEAGLEHEADVMGRKAEVAMTNDVAKPMFRCGATPVESWAGANQPPLAQGDPGSVKALSTGVSVQRLVADAADPGLTKNMTDMFIKRHVLNGANVHAVLANTTPPRLKANQTYVRDRDDGNTASAYAQALHRFNHLNGTETHVLELPQNYPEYETGKRMNVARAAKVDGNHVEVVIERGWHFQKVAADETVLGLSENTTQVTYEAVLKSSSVGTRKAKLGVKDKKINHYPAEHNPFLH